MEETKSKVIEFLKSQPGYEKIKDEPVSVIFGESDGFFILVGQNLQVGVGGFGRTLELAFEDFVNSWNHFKGVEWIEKNR